MKKSFVMLTALVLLFNCGKTLAHINHENESNLKTWKTSDGLVEIQAFSLPSGRECKTMQNQWKCDFNSTI